MTDPDPNAPGPSASPGGNGATSSFISNVPLPPRLHLGGNLSENWKQWKQIYDAYETVTDLKSKPDNFRVAAFITCIGPEALNIHNSLPYQEESERQNIDRIFALWNAYCIGETNVIYERCKFNNRNQEPSESIETYAASLRALAATCAFGALNDELIRDRIVCGIHNNAVRRKLLQEPKLSLSRCIDLCRATETTTAQVKAIAGQADNQDLMANYVGKQNSPRRPTGDTRGFISECKFCGRSHKRNKESCPAYGKFCSGCGRRNHFVEKCSMQKSPGKRDTFSKGKIHAVKEETTSSDEEILILEISPQNNLEINAVSQSPLKNKIFAPMFIKGRQISFQLDSGATCNVLPEHFVPPGTMVEKSDHSLRLYSKALLPIKGICKLKVANPKTQTEYTVRFIIVKGDYVPLLGANAAQKMGLLTVNYANIFDENVDNISSNSIASNSPFQQTHHGAVPETVMSATAEAPLSAADIENRFGSIFEGLGHMPGKLHLDIDESQTPVVMPPRRVPIALKAKLKAELERLEDLGVIQKVTGPTDWVSNLVIAEKPNGKLRVCIDPQHLNKALKRSHYPLPLIDDVLPELEDVKVFSKIDLKEGYLQIELDDESSMLTTFQTPWGRWRYLRMPFGIKPAAEHFQHRFDQCIEGLCGVYAVADDALITGKGATYEEAVKNHDNNMLALLNRCQEKNIKLNKDKFKFKCKEVSFIGHTLTQDGLKIDPAKVEAITKMEKPQDVAGVQRFIGMVKYLAKFLPRLSEVCEPLRSLTHKDAPWVWGETHDKAFQDIQRAICEAPVLKYFDHRAATEGQGDASSKGLGFVLMQEGRPVSYASRALTPAEQNYSQIEKELLAQVFGVEHHHTYIYGREITLWTDHKPLVSITSKPLASAPKRLQRLLLRLQSYDVKICYKPGKEMVLADTLSRAYLPTSERQKSETEEEVETIHMINHLPISEPQLKEIQRETTRDTTLQSLKETILQGWPESKEKIPQCIHPYFSVRDELATQDDVIFKGQRAIIPESLRQKIREKLHVAHTGIQSCLRRAREAVYWPGMNKDLADFISKCEICNTFQNNQAKEPLIPREIPSRPWQIIAADIFTVNNKDFLCTVDCYSNYFEIDRLFHKTAGEVKKKLKRHFSTHGIPEKFMSDNVPFSSKEFQDFAKEYEFTTEPSSPEYAQSNGKAENAVKTAKMLMKKAAESGNDFYLMLLEWRNTPSEGMDSSPSQRMFSRRAKTLLPMSKKLLQPKVVTGVQEKLRTRKQIQSKYYNRGTKELNTLRKGDVVRIKPGNNDRTGRWTKGCVIEQVAVRSYNVKTEDGKILRRNRKFLRHTKEPFNVDEEDSIVFPTKEQEAAIENPEDRQPEDREPLDPQEPLQVQPGDVNVETDAARPAEIRFDHRQLNFYQPVTTRSGRRVIRPDYLAGHNN